MATNVKVISRCIYSWLNYLQSVSKSDLLLESSVRFPIAECIERRFGKEVKLECKYPEDGMFQGHKLDFRYVDNDITCNIELKFLGDYTDVKGERTRYLSDLIRLASISETKTECYFILAGGLANYNSNFNTTPIEVKNKKIPDGSKRRDPKSSVFRNWFPEECGSQKDINLDDYKGDYNDGFRKIYGNDLPSWRIGVQLVAKEHDVNYP